MRLSDTSECDLEFQQDDTIRVDGNSDQGFHFPYYLWVPTGAKQNELVHLLVEPNNTGTATDDFDRHDKSAARLAQRSHATAIAKKLGVPLLVPVFPRPMSDWRTYTHALDEDTLEITEPQLKRIDLQLIAMIRDAQRALQKNGVDVQQRVFMHGFSASGTFANRFVIIHPTQVRAVAAGGLNAIPTLPTQQWKNTTLPYPVGIADFNKLTGTEFDRKAYLGVSQYLYMGDHDRNDTTLFRDAFDEEQAKLVHELIGKPMPDRWKQCQQIYKELGVQAQMVTYNATGHTIRPEMLDDIVAFFRANTGETRKNIEPHQYPYKPFEVIEEVHISGIYWQGDERIPEFARELLNKQGHFVICIDEWIKGQDHRQLDNFCKRVPFKFQLKAEGREAIDITPDKNIGNCSKGDGSFQGFVVRLNEKQLATMAKGVEYRLIPHDTEKWKSRGQVRLTRP